MKKANYTIDWGDGTVETFVGYFCNVNYFFHEYQYPPTGFLNRNITVNCQLIPQSSPSSGYSDLIQNCPNLPNIIFTSTTTIKLETFNYPDCLGGKIVREFKGNEVYIGGTKYRVECKLKQISSYTTFIFTWRQPKIGATVVFNKLKNGKWKKTKSIGHITLAVRGDIYRLYDCSNLFYTINYTKIKNKAKKIKLTFIGILGSNGQYFPDDFHTSKYMPNAINADFVWKYNNNQTAIGSYNELLKP